MKKRKVLTAILFIFVINTLILGGCSSQSKPDAELNKTDSDVKKIYVATQNDYPPFDYVDESGKIVGYDVDVVKEIDKHLPQYEFEFITGPWATVVPSLEANKAQMIADQMSITPEREKKFLFSDPYFYSPLLIIVKKGRTDIQALDDLKGKTVEVSVGDSKTTFLEEWNKANGNKITLKYTENSQPDIYKDIEAGRADATLNDIVMTNAIVEKTGVEVEYVGKAIKSEGTVFVFNKDDQGKALKDDVNKVIKQLVDDGTLTKIAKKWTGEDYKYE